MTRPLPTPEVLEAVRLGLRPTSRWGIFGASRKQLDRTAAETAAEIAAIARARVEADPDYRAAQAAYKQALADYPRPQGAVQSEADSLAAEWVATTRRAFKQAEAEAYARVYGQASDAPSQAGQPQPVRVIRESPRADGPESYVTRTVATERPARRVRD